MTENFPDTAETLDSEKAKSLWLKTLNRADYEPHHWNEWVKENPLYNVTFANVDFGALREKVPDRKVTFSGFKFPMGRVSFVDTNFGHGPVNFNRTNFGAGDVNFFGAKFEQGDVLFEEAEFGDGDVQFTAVTFGEGVVSFFGAKFGNGETKFNGLKDEKRNGDFIFEKVNFGGGKVDFSMSKLGKGVVSFSGAEFGNGPISFEGTNFGMGAVSFLKTQFGDGNVNFHAAEFRNGRIEEDGKENGHVLFDDAVFGKGNLRFDRALIGSSGQPLKWPDKIKSGSEKLDYMNVLFRRTSFGEGDISFENARLGNGKVLFEYAKIGVGNVSFERTSFGLGKIEFFNTRVAADFIFMPSKLTGPHPLHFRYCRFLESFQLIRGHEDNEWKKPISFEGSSFNGATDIRNIHFIDIPDFLSTSFAHHLSLDDISYDPKIRYKSFGPVRIKMEKCREPKNACKLQRLKDLSEKNGNHSLALRLHADDLRTRRWNQTTMFPSIIDALYDEFCEYGLSIWRPSRYLIYSTLLFTLIYVHLTSKPFNEIGYADYLLFSISNSIPFLAISRNVRDLSLKNLFEVGDLSTVLYALLSAQGLIAAIFLFLIGLGLRNHFRI
tara:strand:- start:605 stop:2428 length:1824 start_codon:yes stop_codon:yes gene_type:complete